LTVTFTAMIPRELKIHDFNIGWVLMHNTRGRSMSRVLNAPITLSVVNFTPISVVIFI